MSVVKQPRDVATDPGFPPEIVLAAACCRWPPSEARNAAIRDAAGAPIDWNRFLKVADRHRLDGLVRDGLLAAGVAMPAPVASELAVRAEAMTHQNLVNAAEEIRLFKAFEEAGLDMLFLKGTTLAIIAYGSLSRKRARDIDLLISPCDLDEASKLLARLGYERRIPASSISPRQLERWIAHSKEMLWVNDARGTQVDLHFALVENPELLGESGLRSPRQRVLLADGAELPTLAPAELFSYLCVHGTYHHWVRLKWLADLAALVPDQAKCERLYRASVALGAGRCSGAALLLCEKLFGTAVPPTLLAGFRRDRGTRRLVATALAAITACDSQEDGCEPAIQVFRALAARFVMKRGSRHSLVELRRQALIPHTARHLSIPPILWLPYSLLLLPAWLLKRARLAATRGSLPLPAMCAVPSGEGSAT